MNCPECGAPVGADEKFCGNCGTPLPGATPDAEVVESGLDPSGDIELPAEQETPAAEEAPDAEEVPDLAPGSAWDAPDQETIYSEPVQLADEPLPVPAQDTYMPDPAGIQDEGAVPAPPPVD
jgi:hypothetical protein